MLKTRVIPILLLRDSVLVKTIKFKEYQYIGDPINAIKIFNEKEVDELVFLDIDATRKKIEPNYNLIKSIASECFMPVCYGGGITNIEQMRKIFKLGVEKISLNYSLLKNPSLINNAIKIFGKQSIVASVDIKKSFFGKYNIYNYLKRKKVKGDLFKYLNQIEELGVGEILINNVDADGTFSGYDLELIRQIRKNINIPMIFCGGAKELSDFKLAKDLGISGAGAGSMFVFHGKHNAVLITYPQYEKLEILFGENS